MNTKTIILLAIIVAVGLSAITGIVVHHNDATANNNAMMMAETVQKKDIQEAQSSAMMQQEEKDKMSAQDTMMQANSNMDSTKTSAAK